MSQHKNSVDHGIDRYHDMDMGDDRTSQLKRIYAEWADTYDHDNDHKLGTVSQPNTVKLLAKYLNNLDAEILDVGCGTGLVGKFLNDVGFTNFDGTDISIEMLEVARKRGYRKLFPADADAGLPIESNLYDAVLCVGMFTHGHVGPTGIPELLRVTKQGGYVVFTVNEGVWETDGFDNAVAELGASHDVDVVEQIKQSYMEREGVDAWYVVLKKL